MLRKTTPPRQRPAGVSPASMRPQRNAAENKAFRADRLKPYYASMRPQRNAAENYVPEVMLEA